MMNRKSMFNVRARMGYRLLCVLGTIALVALGCHRTNDETSELSVVSDIIPIAQLIGDVVGDVAEVHHVIPNGVDPHSFSMRPSDLITLERADIIVTVGSFFVDTDSIVDNLESMPILIDVTKVVDVISSTDEHNEDEHMDKHDDDEHMDKHDDGHEEEHADEHGHRHDHSGIDPHVWLIPDHLITIANAVVQALQEIDGTNAEHYAANLERVTDDLTAIAVQYRNSFGNCAIPYLVTDHNAFGYYEYEYGLYTEALGHVEHTQVSSTEDVRRLIDTINTHNIPLIFNVYGTHADTITTIAEQGSAQVATLYHMESFPTDGAVQTYRQALLYNYEVISDNLKCGTS